MFLPFVLSEPVYEAYKSFNAAHGMIVSFIKFAVLSTAGEMLGARITTGRYYYKGFGLISKMLVWGILGMGINMAMIIFSSGTPAFLEDPAQDMRHPYSGLQRLGPGPDQALEDGRALLPRQLESPVGLRLQEDHPPVLVPGPYGDLPAAALRPRSLRRPARGRPRRAPGPGCPQKITLPNYGIIAQFSIKSLLLKGNPVSLQRLTEQS